MDDLINKMRQTEEEAKQIIAEAEKNAQDKLSEATIAAAKYAEEKRKTIYERLAADKDAKYQAMIDERDKRIAENIAQYKASFGNIEAKKQSCIAVIEKDIAESLK